MSHSHLLLQSIDRGDKTKLILSQSAAGDFRNCRKLAKFRHVDLLMPQYDPFELTFGHAVHTVIELMLIGHEIEQAVAKAIVNLERPTQIVVGIIAEAYHKQWLSDESEWEVVGVELQFRLPLLDSENKPHHMFDRGGKIDAIFRHKVSGKFWIVEHKTAAKLDSAYLSRLWLDFQITYYSAALKEVLWLHDIKPEVEGVLYDIITKPPKAEITPKVGENDAEWQLRYDAAKNKKLLKRKMSETEGQFADRIREFYAEPGVFHREKLILAPDDLDLALEEAVDIADDFAAAISRGNWYRNTARCFHFNKACSYLAICQSRDNPLIIENQFKRGDRPNPELAPTP